MEKAKIEAGRLVVSDGMVGVYRVVGISSDGETADIEKFDIEPEIRGRSSSLDSHN
jgi:hypothetical protein